MAVYSVFEPPLRGDLPDAAAERFVFVRDGFSWGAFLLGPLWMAWRRLWLVLLAYLLVMVTLSFVLRFLGASAGVETAIGIIVALLVGLEAASLRGWTLKRRGWSEAGIVIADGVELAERRFFDARSALRSRQRSVANPPAAPRASGGASDIIGLFPEPGVNR